MTRRKNILFFMIIILEIDYNAQNYIIQICNRIEIDYELLINNNYSDKCYS